MKNRTQRKFFYLNAIKSLNETIRDYEVCLERAIAERNVLLATSNPYFLKEAISGNQNMLRDSPLQKSLVRFIFFFTNLNNLKTLLYVSDL